MLVVKSYINPGPFDFPLILTILLILYISGFEYSHHDMNSLSCYLADRSKEWCAWIGPLLFPVCCHLWLFFESFLLDCFCIVKKKGIFLVLYVIWHVHVCRFHRKNNQWLTIYLAGFSSHLMIIFFFKLLVFRSSIMMGVIILSCSLVVRSKKACMWVGTDDLHLQLISISSCPMIYLFS